MGASLQTSLSRVYGFRIIDSDSVETLLATSFVRMMVSSGLAGAHVQPVLEKISATSSLAASY